MLDLPRPEQHIGDASKFIHHSLICSHSTAFVREKEPRIVTRVFKWEGKTKTEVNV